MSLGGKALLGALLATLVLTSKGALGAEYVVVLAEVLTHEQAQGLADELASGGAATRVYRRFQPGQGWGYTVEVLGLDGSASARRIAADLGRRGHPAEVFGPPEALSAAGPAADKAEAVSPSAAAARRSQRTTSAISVVRDRKAEAFLKAAAREHEGGQGGATLEGAPAVVFRFERRLLGAQAGMAVHHEYVRQGLAHSLRVQVTEGEGTNSYTLITPGNRALLEVGGVSSERDPKRVLDIVERFSPEAVLGLPLSLSWTLREGVDWRGLMIVEEEGPTVLVPQVERDEGVIYARFSPDDGLLQEVRWRHEGETRRWLLSDYRLTSAGILLPHHLQISADGVELEEVSVEALETHPEAPAAAFDLPDSAEP